MVCSLVLVADVSDSLLTGTFHSVDFITVLEDDEGGHAANSNCLRDVLSLVDIELSKGHLAFKFTSDSFVLRSDSHAGRTPGSESINDADGVL